MSFGKLNIEDFEEDNICLFIIHTSLEDYRLAYLLNRELNIQLTKASDDLKIESSIGYSAFTHFIHDDENLFACWDLIQNKTEIQSLKMVLEEDLFSIENNSVEKREYLLPEYKNADYVLKVAIPENVVNASTIVSKIQSINQISTAYEVDFYTLKSKINLIF